MRIALCCVFWLGVFELHVHAQDSPDDIVFPRPDERQLLEAAVRQAEMPRRKVDIGGVIYKEMPIAVKVTVIYERSADLRVRTGLKRFVQDLVPSKKDLISTYFDARRSSRKGDADLLSSEWDETRILQEVQAREHKRSLLLHKKITAHTDSRQNKRIVEHLLKQDLTNLVHPFVLNDLKIDRPTFIKLRSSVDRMMISISDFSNSPVSARVDNRAKSMVATFDLLNRQQLLRYFVCAGKLKHGQALSEVLSRYPLECRELLADMIRKKS